uniref:Uncharacterized protein n=1 Tax=Globodera rostochiensis TaxID=31243 RepID=A0A914HN78_GLORO
MIVKRMFSATVTSNSSLSKFAKSDPGISSQLTIEKSFAQLKPDGEMTMKIDQAIYSLVCTAGLPFSFVEEPGLRNLLKIMAPHYKIRGRNFFTNESLPRHYDLMLRKVKNEIAVTEFVTIAVDSWLLETA